MKRNVAGLANKEYDVIVVGGGIFGICAAWDAALRGLSVAVLERGDFAEATSANCFGFVHGGLRYLQHADLPRVRESSRERNTLLRIAPHLVQPLPVVVPTYGYRLRGKPFLKLAFLLYDLITYDRNRGLGDRQKHIPRGRFISREECLELFPDIKRDGLTGAAVFYEAQMYSPTRLAFCYLRSAVEAGAEAANYVEATGFLRNGDRIVGVQARDALTEERLQVRGKVVLNAAGPWAERVLERGTGVRLSPGLSYSRDTCFVVPRRLTGDHVLALQVRTKDPDAILSRGGRHLFIAPWRDYTLVGVWHKVHEGSPDEFTVTEEELQIFLNEVNEAYPAFALTREDVSAWKAGLVLFGQNRLGETDLSFGKRSRIVDHAREHGVEGLVTLVGVRYTTSGSVAGKVVDLVFQKLGRRAPKSATAVTPIYGGRIEQFGEFSRQAVERRPPALAEDAMGALLHKHGSEVGRVLRYIDESPELAERVGSSTVIKAEVVHAIREEMAQKLGDVIFRRTELGAGIHPGEAALKMCAELMASELGWDEDRTRTEIEEAQKAFPSFHNESCVNEGQFSNGLIPKVEQTSWSAIGRGRDVRATLE